MSKNWTDQQLLAIESRDKTLLVSAAAGSGKTATLTERIIRSLTDPERPLEINRMLIVTFTISAAAELRSKISDALSDALAKDPSNRHLMKQMIELGSASICTIHSFCLDLIHTNFQRLSLPASFRIADESEMELLFVEIMNELLEEKFSASEDNIEFCSFADNFTGTKNESNLAYIFISLYKKLIAFPESVIYIKNCANNLRHYATIDFFASPYGEIIGQTIKSSLSFYHCIYCDALDYFSADKEFKTKYSPAFSDDLALINALIKAIEDGDYLRSRQIVSSYAPQRIGRVKESDQTYESQYFRDIRDKFKDHLRKKLLPKFFTLEPGEISDCMLKTAELCDTLYNLLNAFDKRIIAEKKRRAICDFSDLERYTYELLYNDDGTISEIAKSVSDMYDAVYIDEYQDVNSVQDRIFAAIAKENNRFMVGDIKQSIYSFRGAEPEIFAEYRKTFPLLSDLNNRPDTANFSLFMSKNFRSSSKILDFVNFVFGFLMENSAKTIDYRHADDALVYGKPLDNIDYETNVKIVLAAGVKEKQSSFTPDEDDDENSDNTDEVTQEALYIADEIKELLTHGKKQNGEPIKPSDIAILMRSTKNSSPSVIAALKASGIPYTDKNDNSLFEEPEILILLSLLNVIDNPRRGDIYLAGIMRSPIYGFTMDELIEITTFITSDIPLYDKLIAYEEKTKSKKCQHFLTSINKYRDISKGIPVDKLIWILYRDNALLGFKKEGENSDSGEVRDNLIRFYEYARSFEGTSFKGLYNFIKYINLLINNKKSEGSGQKADENCVQIMTIHQSKGLEFPVCFLCGTSKKFNLIDVKENLLFDHSCGIAMNIKDTTGFAVYDTPIRQAIAQKITQKIKEEEMRVLYVGLTRAREFLYVTAQLNEDTETYIEKIKRISKYPCEFNTMSCNTYIEWILQSYLSSPITDSVDIIQINNDCQTQISENNSFIDCDEPVDCTDNNDVDSSIDSENINNAVSAENNKTDSPNDELIELKNEFNRRFNFKYPKQHLTSLPAKLSVTHLYPTILDGTEEEITTSKIISPDQGKEAVLSNEFSSVPLFLAGKRKASAAEKGTATHVFLQFCDYDSIIKIGVDGELNRLIERKFIPGHYAELVNLMQIQTFVNSELLSSLCRAKKVWRELRFNIHMPSVMFTQDEELSKLLKNEKLLVQGVIDCLYEDHNGEITLCDYKTDYLTQYECENPKLAEKKLRDRHSQQLAYYKYASEEILQKPINNVLIYSTQLGKTISL